MIKKRFLLDGQIPKISYETKPEILGGIIVEIGDKTIDLSLVSRVAALRQSLENTVQV